MLHTRLRNRRRLITKEILRGQGENDDHFELFKVMTVRLENILNWLTLYVHTNIIEVEYTGTLLGTLESSTYL